MLLYSQTPSSSHSQRYPLMQPFYSASSSSPAVVSPQQYHHDLAASYHRLASQSFPVPNHPSSGSQATTKIAYDNDGHSPLSRSYFSPSVQSPSSQTLNVSATLSMCKRKRNPLKTVENEKDTASSFLGGSSPLSSTTGTSYAQDSNQSKEDVDDDEDNIFESKVLQPRSKRPKIILKRSTKNLPTEFARKVSYERRHVPDSDSETERHRGIPKRRQKERTGEEEDESINCANVLMSLGHGRADGLAFSRQASSSCRAKRAARRAGKKASTVQSDLFSKISCRKYKAPKKTYDIKSEFSERSQISKDEKYPAHRPPLSQTEIRSFPAEIPMEFNGVKMLEAYPMFYRKFRVPSLMKEEAKAKIFGITSLEEASKIDDPTFRQAAIRGLEKFSMDFNEPRTLLDLYTPRYTFGVGVNKQALCPICYEEGHIFWRKTKQSQYNFHMITFHGISPKTVQPFEPPIAFRMQKITQEKISKRREWMLQGQCHNCKKFVDMESVRDAPVNVPERYFWEHARDCHHIRKGNSQMARLGGSPYVEDELYRRVVQYEDSKTVSKEA